MIQERKLLLIELNVCRLVQVENFKILMLNTVLLVIHWVELILLFIIIFLFFDSQKCATCEWDSTYVKCTECDAGSYLRHDNKGCVTNCQSNNEYKAINTAKLCVTNCYE